MKPTPLSLKKAIENGLEVCKENSDDYASVIIKQSVRDFLAQKFSVPILQYADNEIVKNILCDLWHNITGEKL